MFTIEAKPKYRVLGMNDEASDCCCCGRHGLKRVVWLQPLDENGEESGVPVHFGTMCAAKALGWGYSDRSSAERRIQREEAETVKRYRQRCGDEMKRLVGLREVAQTRVAFSFDIKAAVWNYGYIYALPGDPIATIVLPEYQQAEIKAAKQRLRDRFPVFACLDRNATAAEMRVWLKGGA